MRSGQDADDPRAVVKIRTSTDQHVSHETHPAQSPAEHTVGSSAFCFWHLGEEFTIEEALFEPMPATYRPSLPGKQTGETTGCQALGRATGHRSGAGVKDAPELCK